MFPWNIRTLKLIKIYIAKTYRQEDSLHYSSSHIGETLDSGIISASKSGVIVSGKLSNATVRCVRDFLLYNLIDGSPWLFNLHIQ